MSSSGAAGLATGERRAQWRVFFLLTLALYLTVTAYAAWRGAVLEPYSDMFDWVARWWAYQADGDLWRFLMTPANLHRPALIMAVQGLDIAAFGASSLLFIAVGVASLIGSTLLLARLAARSAPALGLPMAATAAMLPLMAGNLLDAVIPINVNYALALVLALLAIIVSEPGPGEQRGPIRPLLALALFAAAALGNAAALAAWPVLLFGAWRGRRGWPGFLLILVAGVAFIALYAWGQQPPPTGRPSPLPSAVFALSVLGLPWTRLAPGLGWIFGLALLAAGGLALVFRGGADAPRPERIATRLILFSLGVAAMAGLGRSGETGTEAPLRYALLMTPLHVGLLTLAGPWIARRLAWPALAAAAIVLLGQQLVMAHAAIATTDVTRALLAQFKAGQRTPAMAERLHPDLAHAAAIQARMDAEGLYQHELHRP